MAVDKETVRSLPVFAKASDELLTLVAKHAVIKEIPANQQIAYEGMCSDWFFVLLSGSIRVYKMSESGREVTLYNVEKDESCVLTIFSIVTQTSYPAFASTQTDIKGLMIPATPFRCWIDQHSFLRDHVFNSLSGRLNDILETFDKVIFQRVDTRVAQFILDKCPQNGDTLSLTHEQLSQELGTGRVVVSRTLEGFAAENLIQLARGRITLLDKLGLAQK
jgi:CRP/FNR family transcriptional regulator